MKKIKQRILAGVLSFSIMLTMLPLTVFAQNSTLYGDVNRSGSVDQSDVNDLKKYLVEYDIDIDKVAADVNLDSGIDLQDLLLIEKYVAGFDVVLGDNVKITFDTDGGIAVDQIMLCNGAVLTDIISEPVTEKEGYIFTGWVKEDGKPFYAEEPITTSLKLRAKFEVLDTNVEETPVSFALEDQSPDISYAIVTTEDLTADEVLANISLLATDGSEPVEVKVVMISSKSFAVSAVNGFNPGCTYELALSEGLFFKDKAQSIRKATFIIHKDEVDNLKYNGDIKYIKDTDEMSYTLDGSTTVVPVLDISLISNGQEDTVSGRFDYQAGGLAVEDTLCIYETVDPRNRDYVANDYEDDSVAFIKVTGISGNTIYFKGLEEKQATDVLFIPDTIPFSVDTLPIQNLSTIDSTSFDPVAWSFMGRSGAPEFDVGDFVVLYNGRFEDMTDTSPVYFGEVTAINGSTISFKKTTKDAIKATNDVFLSKPMSGDELLENIDTESVEEQIEEQAVKSGFAQDAVDYLATMATKTENFKNMTLENVAYTDGQGKSLTQAQAKALAKAASKPKIDITAKISKNCTNFEKGVRLELGIGAEFSIKLDDGEMKFALHATFIEEIYVKVNMFSHADVTWYLFVPVLDGLTFGANTDIKNYTSIAIDLRIYTVQDTSLWDDFKEFQSKYKNTLNQIKELQQKIDEATESKDKLDSYKHTIKNLWSKLPAGCEALYNNYCDQLGEMNMSSKLNSLLQSTSEETTSANVQDLMNRYSKMMKNETSWVTLVEKNIFEAGAKFAGGLVSVNFSLDFVIKANVNISIGVRMEYLVGKRYSFWIDIIDKTSGSSITDLTDEKFAFTFYVMGYIGLKMGIKATVSLGVLWGLAEMGISGEFGPYIKLWGYFIYTYAKMRPANTDKWNVDSQMAGALYLEFGIYITISFNIDVVKKTVYNPDLYDKEFPILSAGVRNNVYAYGYKIDKDEVVLVKDHDNNSNNGIDMILPESYRLMQYMDLVEGNIQKSVYDYSNFIVTLSNSNFEFDSETGNISVTVPDQVHYMKCNLTFTWKQGKLSFTKKDLRIVIPLVWTDLSVSELKEKFTVTVNVGNPTDGYIPVWSERVMKGEIYALPAHEDVLGLINYADYNFDGSNLKYASITGYGSQPTTDLTTYMDQDFYFDVTLKEYTLKVNGVQNANGSTGASLFTAKFGEKFDISPLKNSGSDDENSGKYTTYYTTVAKDQGGDTIFSDIGRVITIGFAKELLSSTTYTATYVDNSITATYMFEGDVSDIADKTVKIKRGTTPPDVFTQDLAAQKAIVKSITPKIGNILSNTTYTVVSKFKPIILRTITFNTNGGSTIDPVQIPEESLIALPSNPTRSGYTFGGWYTDSSLQTPFVLKEMPEYNFTLYAKWDGNQNKITFDANGGALPSGITNPITVINGTTYGTLPTPIRSQYKFTGWYTARTNGTQISTGDTVHLLNNTTLYAVWVVKATISASDVTCVSQSKTYNRSPQSVTFTVPIGLEKSSFIVSYMRQGFDTEWVSKAENAGTYNVKISRPEDGDYKLFEKTFMGVFTINKAASTISKAPSAASVYYGNIVPNAMTYNTDYIGENIEYAVSTSQTTQPTTGWTVGSAYNIYDSSTNNITGNSVYLWARVAESENYLTSTSSKVSTTAITIPTKPKALISSSMGGTNLFYLLTIKTSDIDKAGTDSKIYVKIGNGAYQHLDISDYDDFEKGDEDAYSLAIDSNLLYNTCGGTIPITLRYEKAGSAPGWHCAWIRLDIYKMGKYFPTLLMKGTEQKIDHWFGANEYDYDVMTESYTLSSYERRVTFEGTFSSEPASLTLQHSSSNFSWDWTTPSVTDSNRGVSYNPYEYINAPELSVSFNNQKYNRYITQGDKSFTLSSSALYSAMAADGVSSLDLTYALEFKPLNGVRSVDASTAFRQRTIKITRSGVQSTALSPNSVSATRMATQFGRSLANVTSDVEIGKNGTFDVSYNLNQNLGIWGAKFAANYDKEKVELLGYTLGNVFTANEVTAPEHYNNGRYVFFASRNDFTDTVATGKLVTLHFKIKDGANLTDYPVTLDTTASQYINGESGIVSLSVNVNAPKINVIGNTADILSQDTITVSASAGSSEVQSVRVKRDNADYIDITGVYSQGYAVTENGTYTFELITKEGDTATTSITYTQIDTVKPVVAVNAGTYTEDTWQAGSVTLTPHNTANNMGKTTFSYRVGENGNWIECSSGLIVNADASDMDTTYYFKAVSEGGVESDIAKYTVKLDNKSPSGEITIGQNKWNTLLNNITFGLFFKDTKAIKIESTDTGSGIAKTEYYLSNSEVSDISSIEGWTEYTKSVTVEPNYKYVVYTRITDKTGNVTIINSDGLVIENTAPVISGIENGKAYCSAVTVTVTDEYLDTVTIDGVNTVLTDSKLILSPTGTPQTVVATDKAGNSTTVTVTVYDDHAWDEGVVTDAPTASKKGVKTYTCTHCGETKTEEIAMLAPSVIEGQNGNWKPDEGGTLTFKSDAAFSDFISVLVDGKVIDAKYYELKEGSIIVTLKADYLATLPAGTHTLGIQSATGTASTEFTVAAKVDDKAPSTTSDNSHMRLWIALLFVSGATLTVFGFKSRKRKAVK